MDQGNQKQLNFTNCVNFSWLIITQLIATIFTQIILLGVKTMIIAELKDVCKTYPAFRLSNVSFSLESGRIIGFIGRNGAGKTTTIKSMLNLIHTESGEIYYFGMPLKGHESEIKQRIGYSTGTVSWYPRKTIREIVNVTRTFYTNWDEE